MTTEENPRVHGHGDCVCCRANEVIGRVFSAFGPSDGARQHFRQSRVEFLKGIRKLLDDRIEKVSRDPDQKGSRIVVE
jgi:hypothetical protein